jgi:hypothetical protein
MSSLAEYLKVPYTARSEKSHILCGAIKLLFGRGIRMQFSGGYRYPSAAIFYLLSALSVAITGAIWGSKCLAFSKALVLFLGLEGTCLIASSYSPVGLAPSQGGFFSKFTWFLKQQEGITVQVIN